MKISWNDRTINTLNLVVALAAIMVTVLLANYSVSPGPNPPKSLSAEFIGPTDPLSDLADNLAGISIEIKSSGKPVDKIYLYQTTLRNSGNTPILPSDFFGDMKITTARPWAIVAVSGSAKSSPQNIGQAWTKVSDTEVSAAPTLLNPGDHIDVTVYLTAPEQEVKALKYDSPAPIEWRVRVVNMPSIIIEMNPFQQFASKQGPIVVHVWGWGVPFLLTIFLLSLWLHLYMLCQVDSLFGKRTYFMLVALVGGLMSLACADALTTYIFGLYPGLKMTVDHWVNLPPIIVNFAMIISLYVASLKHARGTASPRRRR